MSIETVVVRDGKNG